MGSKETSFTAADSLPLKILLDKELVESIQEDKRILPRHIQLNLENKCTQDCDWCSCSNRDKNLELPYEIVIDTIKKFKSLGTKACTITGGGEPLLYPRINDILRQIKVRDIDVGMVTNADLINKLGKKDLENLTWMRISFGDGKKISKNYWEKLQEAVNKGNKIDWSFSYVIANKNPDYNLIKNMVNFSNENNFAHIRMVNDIFNADKLFNTMHSVKLRLRKDGIDDSKVIYQDRSKWTRGNEKCLISLLKPVITADGKLGACCGEQYCENPPRRDYIGNWGTLKDIDKIWEEQKYFDGSKCVKCYYSNYNTLLSTLSENIKHKNFV